MTTRNRNKFRLPALIAGFGLMLAGRVAAQTFTNLHSFTTSIPNPVGTNSDGTLPWTDLIFSGNTLYGTTMYGGLSSRGTVFAINVDGTGFTNLHSFEYAPSIGLTNSEGASPIAGLILSGNTLYGTASYGGSSGNGTVFKVNTNGTGFTNLHSFTVGSINSDGTVPKAGLILSSNTLYGTAYYGGSAGKGTVFALNTDGTGFTNLHNFTATIGANAFNSDGANPLGGLILSGNTLYGTASAGGTSGKGSVFKVNTDGTGFTNLHSFTYLYSGLPLYGTNSDGAGPYGGLTIVGNTLFGTAQYGGISGGGTVFGINTNGASFTNLHNFAPLAKNGSLWTNSDGFCPIARLFLSGNVLYGTAAQGGSSGWGTVFAVRTDGTGFTNLYFFTASAGSGSPNSDGAGPNGGVILSGNTLYGTAYYGGSSGNGTVFSLTLSVSAPQLTIIPSDTNVILTWPTNYAGFDYSGFILQSTTNLFSQPVVWNTNLSAPVVVNGQNTVTNPISATQQFYRLSQ